MSASFYYVYESSPDVFEVLEQGYSLYLKSGTFPWSVVYSWDDDALAMIDIYRVAVVDEKAQHKIASVTFNRIDKDIIATASFICDDIEAIRSAKIAMIDEIREGLLYGGFRYRDVRFQSRASDWTNITSTGIEAGMAVSNGALPGDLRWKMKGVDFGWIAENNSFVSLDAQAMYGLYQRGSAYASLIIMNARQLKNQVLLAHTIDNLQDIDINAGWPNTDAREATIK